MKLFFFEILFCLISKYYSAQVFFMDYDFVKKNKIENVLIKKEKNGEEYNHQYFSFDFLEMYEEDLLTYSFSFNRSSVSKEVYIEKDYITLGYFHDVINRSYILSLDGSKSEIREAMSYEFIFSERLESYDHFKIKYTKGKIDTVKAKENKEEITEVYYYEKPNADLITKIDVFSNSVYVYSYNFYYNSNDDAQVNSVIKNVDSLEIVLRKQSEIIDINPGSRIWGGPGSVFKSKVINIETSKRCIPYMKVNTNDFSDEDDLNIRPNTSYVDLEGGYYDSFYFGFNFCLVNHGDFVFNLPKQKIIETRVINRERILDYENKEGSFEYALSNSKLLITKKEVNNNDVIEKSSFLFYSDDNYIKSLGGYTNLKTTIEERKENKETRKVEKEYKIYNSIN